MSNARTRERSQRLQLDTLIVASLASAAAALLTSFVWRPGAIIGAAITPVVVAFVSEMLQRPAQRITQVRAVRSVGEPAGAEAEIRAARLRERDKAAVGPPEPARDRLSDAPSERVPDRIGDGPPAAVPPPLGAADGAGPTDGDGSAPLRVYRKPRPNLKIVLITAAAAFAIATAALTLPELLGGGSVTGDGRTTLFSAGDGKRDRDGGRETDGGRERERDGGELREPSAEDDAERAPDGSQTSPRQDSGTESPTPAPTPSPTPDSSSPAPAPSTP